MIGEPQSTEMLKGHGDAWISPDGKFYPLYTKEFYYEGHYVFAKEFFKFDPLPVGRNDTRVSVEDVEDANWIHLSSYSFWTGEDLRPTKAQRELMEEWYLLNQYLWENDVFLRDQIDGNMDDLKIKIPR